MKPGAGRVDTLTCSRARTLGRKDITMRRRRPIAYNPAQVLSLINTDRSGAPLSCPACGGGAIERAPDITPPPPHAHVTLHCMQCGRTARYIVDAA